MDGVRLEEKKNPELTCSTCMTQVGASTYTKVVEFGVPKEKRWDDDTEGEWRKKSTSTTQLNSPFSSVRNLEGR